MSNIRNYNFTGIDYRVSNSEYYDFYLNTDGYRSNNLLQGDFDNEDFDSEDWLTTPLKAEFDLISMFNFNYYYSESVPQITNIQPWDGAIVSGLTASTYGLTGLDNGDISYEPLLDNFSHDVLLSALTGTTLVVPSGSTNMVLHKVTGYTGQYVYPIQQILSNDNIGNYARFCGGFYQGYYKLDGFDYDVLPNRYQKGFTLETCLRKSDSVCSGTTGTTLNDLYPNNKGFFYYIGTRAENKFWNIFTGNTSSDCTSGSTEFCMDVKESDIDINNITVEGSATTISVPISPPPVDIKLIENQFLIYGRSNGKLCAGEMSLDGFGQVRAGREFVKKPFYSSVVKTEESFPTNPFLIFGRSNGKLCSRLGKEDNFGETRANRNFSGNTIPITELDKDSDLIGNALGFRIKDDGSIGYRMLVESGDCKSVEVIEEYSMSGMVTSDQWQHIVIKWINNDTFNECDLINGEARKGKFKFYVNGFLIFTSKELIEFIPKRLDDLKEKQVGVPYNISIGGGTQGLLESMTFDGQDPEDLGLILEQNFAGSFIGDIAMLNLYQTPLNWCEIKELYNERLINFT
jgi:hypothetical protein